MRPRYPMYAQLLVAHPERPLVRTRLRCIVCITVVTTFDCVQGQLGRSGILYRRTPTLSAAYSLIDEMLPNRRFAFPPRLTAVA